MSECFKSQPYKRPVYSTKDLFILIEQQEQLSFATDTVVPEKNDTVVPEKKDTEEPEKKESFI